MSIDKIIPQIHLPKPGGNMPPEVSAYLWELIGQLEQKYLLELTNTLNLVLDTTGTVTTVYFGIPSSAGVYTTGTWRISTASASLSLDRYSGSAWVAMATLSSAKVMTLTALTLTGFSGVLKATTGVVAGGATLDDVAEGSSYKRVPAATYTDLTDGGTTTLHTHAGAHTQGTDQGLDTGGPNAVTVAQVKSAVTASHAAGTKAGTVTFNDNDGNAHSVTISAGLVTSWVKGGVEQLA